MPDLIVRVARFLHVFERRPDRLSGVDVVYLCRLLPDVTDQPFSFDLLTDVDRLAGLRKEVFQLGYRAAGLLLQVGHLCFGSVDTGRVRLSLLAESARTRSRSASTSSSGSVSTPKYSIPEPTRLRQRTRGGAAQQAFPEDVKDANTRSNRHQPQIFP